MLHITRAEIVLTYWQHAVEIAQTGRLAFVIRGNVAWKSAQPEGINDSTGLWLKSNVYDPEGRRIDEEPVRLYLQWQMNTYEIWGTIRIALDVKDAPASKKLIDQSLEKISLISNTMSLLFSASLRWYPARYILVRQIPTSTLPERKETESWKCVPLPRSQDEQTYREVKDEDISLELFPFVEKLLALQLAEQRVITTAIDWHAQANRYASGLNRFLNYWESIELLGNYFYKKKQKPESERIRAALNVLNRQAVTQENCYQVIKESWENIYPSAQIKIIDLLDTIYTDPSTRQTIKDALFKPDNKSGKSLYGLRNDVAHGHLSEQDLETVESVRHQLFHAQELSRAIILATIRWAKQQGGL